MGTEMFQRKAASAISNADTYMSEITGLHKSLVDGLNSAVVLLDEDVRVKYMNPAAETLLGHSLLRALGRDMWTLMLQEPEDKAALQAAIADSVPYTKRRAQVSCGPGRVVVVDYSVSPLEIQGQSYLLMELHDIDRLLRINREELLVNTHDTTRQMVRGLAHEIKNPLGGIKGAAQLLDSELSNPNLQEYTRVIAEEVDRLRNLVDRLLGPNKPPSKERINVHRVVERVITLLNAEGAGGVTVCKDYDPSVPDIDADPEMMMQAVLNIARNALQSLQESNTQDPMVKIFTRIEWRVSIAGVMHPMVCRIDVVDNGPGIKPHLIDEIFYPMITGRSDGTGLGLSISQSVIQEHGGIIECESEPGHTLFSILLPVV